MKDKGECRQREVEEKEKEGKTTAEEEQEKEHIAKIYPKPSSVKYYNKLTD